MSLLLHIMILLIASLVCVPLAKRYSSNTVLGYLIAGLLLGSHAFALIDDTTFIKQLTDLGMLLVMFFLGFAFQPQQLWVERRHILKRSGLPFAIILLILSGSCFFLFKDILSSILLGIILAFSATALIQQYLQSKQQLNSKLGQTTLANLQLQALLAMVFISLMPLLEQTTSTRHGIAYFAAIIATISGVFLASRYLIRPAFRFLAKRHSLELIPMLSLLVVLAVIVLMDVLNIHSLIGAFLAGLLLAETEFKTEVTRLIYPFKDAAIGLFFLAIGLSLPLNVLWQTPLFIMASILSLILIKAIVIAALSFYQHRNTQFSLLSAVLLAQSGELSFILLKLAASEDLLNTEILDPALLIVSGSMLLTPVLYWLMNSLVLPRLHKKISAPREDIPQDPILIVGFGRFGQVIARALHAQGQQFSVMDSNQPDATFIEDYGHYFLDADVTQVENLRAAGIEYCKLLILAIDDVEDSMNLARHLRLNYPDLHLLVRARDRHHAHLLHDLGIEHVWRETYLSALAMAQQALISTGLSPQIAQQQIAAFQTQDEQLLRQQYGISNASGTLEAYPEVMAELEYLFEKDKTVNNGRMTDDQNQQSD